MVQADAQLDEDVDEGSFAPLDGIYESRDALLGSPNALRIPPAVTLLRPLPPYPPPGRDARFEQALQLRMTQVVLVERVEGAESASRKWVELFAWYAQRTGGKL